VEKSVAPRIGTEEASKYVSWIKEYEKNLERVKEKRQ